MANSIMGAASVAQKRVLPQSPGMFDGVIEVKKTYPGEVSALLSGQHPKNQENMNSKTQNPCIACSAQCSFVRSCIKFFRLNFDFNCMRFNSANMMPAKNRDISQCAAVASEYTARNPTTNIRKAVWAFERPNNVRKMTKEARNSIGSVQS